MVAAGSAGVFGVDGWSRFLQKHPGDRPVNAAPKWPVNRFGVVLELPGALPSTTFSRGTVNTARCTGRGDNPVCVPTAPLAKQNPSLGVQYPTHRWSVNRSTAALGTSNSQVGGKDEVHLVLVQVTL